MHSFQSLAPKKVIRLFRGTAVPICSCTACGCIAASSSHNKPALCSSVLEQDTAALTSRCSFWLLTLTAPVEGRQAPRSSRQKPCFSFGDRCRRRRSNNQLSCPLVWIGTSGAPAAGRGARNHTPRRRREDTFDLRTLTHTHLGSARDGEM